MKDEIICISNKLSYIPAINQFVEIHYNWDIKYPAIIEIEYDKNFIKQIKSNEISDEEKYKKLQMIEFTLTEPVVGFIVLTNQCNFNCGFCYANANSDKEQKQFNLEHIGKLIEYTNQNSMSDIAFTGGEPLLEWEILKACVERYNLKKFTIYTNGALLDDEKVKFILKRNGTAYISLDVPSSHGTRMHDDISDLLKSLIKKYPEFRNRIEVSSCMTCNDFSNIYAHRKTINGLLGGNTPIDYHCICNGMDTTALDDVIAKDKVGLLQNTLQPNNSIFGAYSRWIGEWLRQGIVLTSCTPNISLNYRGDISLCHEYGSSYDANPEYSKMVVCNINDIKDKNDLYNRIYGRTIELKTGFRKIECNNCALRWMCGGICWANIRYNSHLCFLAKQITPHFFEILSIINDGIFKSRVTDGLGNLFLSAIKDGGIKNGIKRATYSEHCQCSKKAS